jgi:hypothetical protein
MSNAVMEPRRARSPAQARPVLAQSRFEQENLIEENELATLFAKAEFDNAMVKVEQVARDEDARERDAAQQRVAAHRSRVAFQLD